MLNIFTRKPKKKRIIIDVQYGLGNRMRALVGAQHLALNMKRDLKVLWTPDLHCEAKFHDLFSNRYDVSESLDNIDYSKMDFYDYMDYEKLHSGQLVINEKTRNDIFIKSAFSLYFESRDIKKENQYLRELQYVNEVNHIISNLNVNDRTGIHIRMGGAKNYDQNKWDSGELISEKAREDLQIWREKSHYNVFINELEKILANSPEQKFFLAADSENIYHVFQERFGDKVSFIKREKYDRSMQQQIYALADMILLSRTKLIMGSNWSSFTQVAGRIGNNTVKLAGIDF